MRENNDTNIEIAENENQLSIKIPQNKPFLTIILAVWLIIWIAAGAWLLLAVFETFSVGMTFATFLWIIGIFIVAQQIIWNLWGEQIIAVSNESLMIKNRMLKREKSKHFKLEQIKNLQLAQSDEELEQSINDGDVEPDDTFDNGMLQFQYQKSIVNFATNVTEREANLILSKVNKRINP